MDVSLQRHGKCMEQLLTVCDTSSYREHISMIRGMVPKKRLLEWSVEDGWEPLCKVNKLYSGD